MGKTFWDCVPGIRAKRSMASIKIEKQTARRKTPFTSAARISARCHPYVYLAEAERFDN